jgi:pterin-4a-carbinolamine dehydratase
MKKRLSLQEFVVTRQAAGAMASQDATAEVADSELKKSKKKEDKKANKANKGNTDTGMPKNEIELNPQMDTNWSIYEEKDKHVVFTFGRMNPPTAGHEMLVDKVKQHAEKVGGEAHIYLSKTQDKKKNPLDYQTKHAFAKKAFGSTVKHTPEGHSNVHGILKHLHSLGYTHATLIAGDDRIEDYKRIANTYNGPGKDYNFKKIEVKSAGARDPDAEGVEGMSASKLRSFASAGKHKEFKEGLPKNLQKHSKEIMDTLRQSLNEELTPQELHEVVSVQTRIKKASKARTMKARLAMGRRRALKRKASRGALTRRAQRTARKFMRARMLRGQKYSDLSYSARAALDRRLKIKSKSVNRLATKLLPRISAAEQRRKLGSGFKTPAGLGRMAGLARESLDLIIRNQMPLAESIVNSLQKKAEQSGIPYEILETVYYRGVADYAAGYRPTITSQQWAFNRVNSFIHEGATYYTADKDLAEGAIDVKAAQKAALQLNKKGKKTIEEVSKVEGTNCKNCIWWKEDTEKPVGKDELNDNGGLKAPNEHYISMSKMVDLISLPGKATVAVKAMCEHEDINDWVTERMCCAKWDAKGTVRDYKGTSPLMNEEGGAGYEGTPELVKKLKQDTPGQNVAEEKKIKGFRNYMTACSEAIEAPYDPTRSSKLDIMQAEQMRKAVAPSWDMIQGHHLSKKFIGKDYLDIETFVKQINQIAVEMDHFPEISNFYNEATIKVGTTDVDGLTAIDFTMAREIDQIANMLGLRHE